ncbi:hypothetical protein AB0M87_16645 [Streptomyces sp. NPDC051320]|uniref:hypothetical protein n=1 Tax=Streptomyces sp. NPDC051320 TaxID=3154644 RepID=UPI00342683D6
MPVVDVVIVGLGATGLAITEALASRTDCRIVGAADIQPGIAGAPLSLVVPGAPPVAVVVSVDELPDADVAVVATSSWVETIEPTLVACDVELAELLHHLSSVLVETVEIGGSLVRIMVRTADAVPVDCPGCLRR